MKTSSQSLASGHVNGGHEDSFDGLRKIGIVYLVRSRVSGIPYWRPTASLERGNSFHPIPSSSSLT
jgi:hypothetical protein